MRSLQIYMCPHMCVCVWDVSTRVLLTLYHQMDESLSWLYIEAVVLAGLAAVRPAHVSCHVADPQDAIVALHLSGSVRHRERGHGRHRTALLHPGPKDDGFGLPRDQTLQVHRVTLLGDEMRAPPWDG